MWRMQSDSYPQSESEESCYVAGLNNMIVSVFSTMMRDVLKGGMYCVVQLHPQRPRDENGESL